MYLFLYFLRDVRFRKLSRGILGGQCFHRTQVALYGTGAFSHDFFKLVVCRLEILLSFFEHPAEFVKLLRIAASVVGPVTMT